MDERELNRNMGCIETLSNWLSEVKAKRLNRNMGCIETWDKPATVLLAVKA